MADFTKRNKQSLPKPKNASLEQRSKVSLKRGVNKKHAPRKR